MIVHGWSGRQHGLHPQLRPFWPYRDDIVADDGFVLNGNRIVMPAKSHCLVKLHGFHQIIENMRLRARLCVFWTGINREIEVIVCKCATCQEVQRVQPRDRAALSIRDIITCLVDSRNRPSCHKSRDIYQCV